MPIKRIYTTTVEGTFCVPVTCQYCHQDFEYEQTLKAQGRVQTFDAFGIAGTSHRELATERATQELLTEASEHESLVPCPRCRKFQTYMIKQYAKREPEWAVILGWLAAIVGVAIIVARREDGVTAMTYGFLSLAVAGGLFWGVASWRAKLDPDSWDEARKLKLLDKHRVRPRAESQ